jgi:hypothetical protein
LKTMMPSLPTAGSKAASVKLQKIHMSIMHAPRVALQLTPHPWEIIQCSPWADWTFPLAKLKATNIKLYLTLTWGRGNSEPSLENGGGAKSQSLSLSVHSFS